MHFILLKVYASKKLRKDLKKKKRVLTADLEMRRLSYSVQQQHQGLHKRRREARESESLEDGSAAGLEDGGRNACTN